VDNAADVRGIDPQMPPGVFNRVADNWRPLLAIADRAGSEWPRRARIAIERAGAREQSICELLLADIHTIFAERGTDRLTSAELVGSLVALEGRPWAEWKAGKPISADGLARLLARFAIGPETMRVGDRTPKGYQRIQFDDALRADVHVAF
jgi:Protein of unknown function (DUF3631)